MEEYFYDIPLFRQVAILFACFIAGWILRLVSQSLIARLSRSAGFKDGDIVARNTGTAIIWCSVLLGADVFVPGSIYPSFVQPYTGKIYHAGCVFVIAMMLARTGKRMLHRIAERRGSGAGTTSLLEKTVQITILILAAAFILQMFGVELTAILTTLGVGGLALALALQETLTNLFAGMHMTIANQFRVGDVIAFDGNEGTVIDVGWRNTLIRKFDDSLLIVPNSKLSQTIVSAYAANAPSFRARVSIPVSVEENLARMEELVIDEVGNATTGERPIAGLLEEPAPLVRLGDWKDGSIDVIAIVSVASFALMGEVRKELLTRIHTRCTAESIRLHNPVRRLVP